MIFTYWSTSFLYIDIWIENGQPACKFRLSSDKSDLFLISGQSCSVPNNNMHLTIYAERKITDAFLFIEIDTV